MNTSLKETVGQKTTRLSELGNIAEDYSHHQRMVKPGVAISFPGVYLKWYSMHHLEAELTDALIQENRSFLQAEVDGNKLKFENQLGFVISHHCNSATFLIVCTWYNTNELWKTVYVKDLTKVGGFELVDPERYVPAFCIWEMAAVWHETLAWGHYLFSKRGDKDKYIYLNDQLEGLIG